MPQTFFHALILVGKVRWYRYSNMVTSKHNVSEQAYPDENVSRAFRQIPANVAASTGSPTWRRACFLLVLFTGVLLACLAWDETVYRWVHEHFNENTRPIPAHLKWPHRVLRSMENWGENVFILVVLYVIWVLDTQRRSRVLLLVLAASIIALGVEGVKRVTGRQRPDESGGVSVFAGPAFGFQGGDWHSFPSGHTASAASFSGSLASFYPPTRLAMVALAVGCGASRVWKERHFLSDCWAAGFWGFVVAFYLPRTRWVRRWAAPMDLWLAGRGHSVCENIARRAA